MVHVRVDLVTELGVCAVQMFNPNPDPADVQKAKEALKVCFTCHWALPEAAVKLGYVFMYSV